MQCIIRKHKPVRSEATLEYMELNNKRDPNIFLEFCSFLEIKLIGNNGVYEANLTYYQYERLRTSVLVDEIYQINKESQPSI